ncbi:hypothetical protein Dsin_020812 [Dipteronia sinensis]|uniref:RNase H type-1 domain-containing protein n=1 Tax=Dipteronia sinensis TaxID=43782 RepID=A0AAE0AA02_9ROSI|nr:hypothetical protein Dsin_020812 [Dipteronia sinensis]
MIDALKIDGDLDSLKSDIINGYNKGIKDCKDLEGVSEILGSHKSSDFNANIIAINDIKSAEVEFPAMIDISKQVEESTKAQIVSPVSLGLTDQPNISSVIRNPIDKPSTRVWSRKFRSATIGDFGDNLVVGTEEEVSLHWSRIAEVVAAPTEVSAVLVHKDGYCGRMCTVDAEVLVTQHGVSDAGIQGNFVQKRRRFYFEEWSNEDRHISPHFPSQVINSWRPPDEECFKINCETAINEKEGRIGLGIVIRDHSGAVMASCFLTLAAFFDANTAETMAIYKGLIFSRDCGIFPCVIESDAAVVVKWINEDSHWDSISGNILVEISALVSGLHVISVSHIPRLANNVAHGLAKSALMVVEDRFWMEEFPPCGRRAVQLDMPTYAPSDSSTSPYVMFCNKKKLKDMNIFTFINSNG